MLSSQAPVFLWGVPRSVSTAFEKALSRHPRIHIEHEPFTGSYYFGETRRSDRYRRGDGQLPTPALDQRELVALNGDKRITFIKELAFQGEPYVTDETLSRCRHLFIAREPVVVYRSLRKIKPDFNEDEFGFAALERVIRRVTRLFNVPHLFIDGDHFRQFPVEVLRQACAFIGIGFLPRMLRWPEGRIREWRPEEALSQAQWHRTLEASQTVLPPSKPENVEIHWSHKEIIAHAESVYGRYFVRNGLIASYLE